MGFWNICAWLTKIFSSLRESREEKEWRPRPRDLLHISSSESKVRRIRWRGRQQLTAGSEDPAVTVEKKGKVVLSQRYVILIEELNFDNIHLLTAIRQSCSNLRAQVHSSWSREDRAKQANCGKFLLIWSESVAYGTFIALVICPPYLPPPMSKLRAYPSQAGTKTTEHKFTPQIPYYTLHSQYVDNNYRV